MRILLTAIFICIYLINPFFSFAQEGCTDPMARNFNKKATKNDGSCVYSPITISPLSAHLLSDTIQETSGLIWWNNYLWTHNDNSDNNLYAIDTANGNIVSKKTIRYVENFDWEEITQDKDYVYVGDFGNNGTGNRKNLHILRIEKTALQKSNSVVCDTIWFEYRNQFDYSSVPANTTDFDCEAFIVTSDSIYLFTKQWKSKKTTVYSLPKIPGKYKAIPIETYDIQGLVTGAHYQPDQNTIVLSGYSISSSIISPFVFLLYDFKKNDFFGGNKRRINLSLMMLQTEGIASRDGKTYFISNEKISNIITVTPKIHSINLSPYLPRFYSSKDQTTEIIDQKSIQISNNPKKEEINITFKAQKNVEAYLFIKDNNKKVVHQQKIKVNLDKNEIQIKSSSFKNETYQVLIIGNGVEVTKTFEYVK